MDHLHHKFHLQFICESRSMAPVFPERRRRVITKYIMVYYMRYLLVFLDAQPF